MEKVQDALNPGHQKDDAILYQTTGATDSRSKENTPGPAESNLTPAESPQSDSKPKSSGGLKSKIDSIKSKFSSKDKDKDSHDSKDRSVSSSSNPPLGSKTSSDTPIPAATTTTANQPRSTQDTTGTENTLSSGVRPSAPQDAASAASIKSGIVGELQSRQKLTGHASADHTLHTPAPQSGDSNTLPIHSKTATSGASTGALGAAGIASYDNTSHQKPPTASSFSPIHRNVHTSTTTQSTVDPIQHQKVTPSATQEPTLPPTTTTITTTNPTQSAPEDHTARNTALGAAGLAGGAYAGSQAFGSSDDQPSQPGQATTTDSAVPQSGVAQTGGSQAPTEAEGVAYSGGTYTARSFTLAPGQEPPKESGYPSPAGNTFGNYGTTAPLRGDGTVPDDSNTLDSTLAGGFGSGATGGTAVGSHNDTNSRGVLQRLDSEPLPIPGSYPAPTPLLEETQPRFPTQQDVGVGPGAAAAAATAASGIAGSRDTSKPAVTPTAPTATTSKPTETTSDVNPAASTKPLPQSDRETHHGRDAAIAGGSGVAAIAAAEAYRRHEPSEPSTTRTGPPTVESIAKSDSSNLTPNQQIYGTEAVGGVDDITPSQKTAVPSTSATPAGDHASSDLTPNQKIYGAANVGGVDSVGQGAPTATTPKSSKLSPNRQIYGVGAVGGPEVIDRKTAHPEEDHAKRNAALAGAGVLGAGGAGAYFASTLKDDETSARTGPTSASAYDSQRAAPPTATQHSTTQETATGALHGKDKEHHHGRDAALASGAAGAAGAGASRLTRSDNEKSTPSSTSQSAYPAQTPPQATHDPSQSTDKDHHHGRDAALAGGAIGATGAGSYALGRSDDDRAIPSSTQQPAQPGHTASHGTHDTTRDTVVQDQSKDHPYGRDAAVAGGVVGTGAGAYALGRSDNDRAVPSTTQQATPAGQSITHDTHDQSRESASQVKDNDHTKEKSAAGGLGAGAVIGTGAYGLQESKERDAAQKAALEQQAKEQQREAEHAAKQAEKDAKEAKKEHAKEEKKAEKEHAKEEKKAEKEHAKEEKKAEKEAQKEKEKHDQELEKQREKQEKEAEKERKKAEKEADKEKKGGLLGFLHRDKDKHSEQENAEEDTEEERRRREAAAGGAAAVGGAGAYAAYNAHSQDTTSPPQSGLSQDRRNVDDGLDRGESQTSQYSRGSQDNSTRTDSPGSERKSRGLGALFHRKDKSRSSVDEDRSSPVAGESSAQGTPERVSSGGLYAGHEGRNKLHKDPPKDYYEKQGITPPQRSSIEQGPISGIHEPDSIPTERTDQYRGAPIGNTPQTVTEPVTGLPMKVGGEYGVGEGGTDANATIPGYRAPQ